MGEVSFGTQEVKMVDRSNISITGVNKIVSFDDEEFLIDTIMGYITIKGENLELIKLDSLQGNVSIKGMINSFVYSDSPKDKAESGIFNRLFK